MMIETESDNKIEQTHSCFIRYQVNGYLNSAEKKEEVSGYLTGQYSPEHKGKSTSAAVTPSQCW